jgi:hypothetical protein
MRPWCGTGRCDRVTSSRRVCTIDMPIQERTKAFGRHLSLGLRPLAPFPAPVTCRLLSHEIRRCRPAADGARPSERTSDPRPSNPQKIPRATGDCPSWRPPRAGERTQDDDDMQSSKLAWPDPIAPEVGRRWPAPTTVAQPYSTAESATQARCLGQRSGVRLALP